MPKDDNTTTQELPLAILFPGDLLDYYAGQNISNPSEDIMRQIFDEMKAEGLFKSYKDKDSAAIGTYMDMIARYRFRQAEAMIAEKRRRG